jgi:hypothetical protein
MSPLFRSCHFGSNENVPIEKMWSSQLPPLRDEVEYFQSAHQQPAQFLYPEFLSTFTKEWIILYGFLIIIILLLWTGGKRETFCSSVGRPY